MSSTALARLHGVRRTDLAVDDLEAAADELDWRCIVLDGSEVEGAEGVLVVWSQWGAFAEAEPKDFATALDVLASAGRGWAVDGLRGGVLLVGEGPDLDVEDL